MSVKLLTEHHLELLSLKEGCRGSSESTLVKMPHCWKSRVTAQITVSTCLSGPHVSRTVPSIMSIVNPSIIPIPGPLTA